ncbi:MAG TPA: hypothetical protein VM282_23970 [Acidimicrobiales bacterium]|nr:hypothetical protein [Acidimicrobiales bacterium]
MKKFLATGHHGPIDPAEGRRFAEASLQWLPSHLADGSLDCVYSMKGGGRLVIASAESEEALLRLLASAPDPERDWTIVELYDGVDFMRQYLATLNNQ